LLLWDRENGKQTLNGTASLYRGLSGSFEGTVPPSPQAQNALSGEREAKYQRSGAAVAPLAHVLLLFLISAAAAARIYKRERRKQLNVHIYINF
jgi:hypothetical protein